MFKKTIFRNHHQLTTLLLVTFLSVPAQSPQQKLLAVLDLTSDGSIPPKKILLISNKINEAVAAVDTGGKYILFERSMLPELLTQLSIKESVADCFDRQCLVLTGNLIGANIMIGGHITFKNNCTDIQLNLVDVSEKKIINSVTLSSGSKKEDFLKKDLPALVLSLLNPENAPPQPSTIHVRKNVFTNPLLYAGTLLVGGATAGAYYYKFYRHHKSDGEPPIDEPPIDEPVIEEDVPLSMDDIPVRTRDSDQ